MMQRGAPFAPWIHMVTLGAVAAVTFWLTKNEVVSAAVVMAASRILGEAFSRVRPRAMRHFPPATVEGMLAPTVAELERLIAALNGDINDVVNLLGAMRAYMDFIKDALRQGIRGLDASDTAVRRAAPKEPPLAR